MENRTTIQVSEDTRKKLKILAAQRDVSYEEILQDMVDVFTELDSDQTILSVPKKLATKTKKNISKSEFKSMSEYVTFLLRIMLYEEGKTTTADVKRVKKRLTELGYI